MNISNSSTDSSSDIFNNFSSNKYVNATEDFLNSNSVIAQIAFLLLILFGFVLVLRLGISILGYMLSPSDSPKLINGMVDAKQLIVVPQDPSSSGAVTIYRSVNQSDGIEFTWSVWIYIDDLTYNSGKYRCVFYKGNDYAKNPDAKSDENQGLNFPNNAPGVYIAPNTNDLIIMMNTFNVINEEITVNDIPLNKWVNVLIRCQNNTLDVYINGTISKSHHLHGVPKQNYGDVYIAPNGGFSGYISNLWYYNYALGIAEITKLVSRGPNTQGKGTVSLHKNDVSYLSLRWFLQ